MTYKPHGHSDVSPYLIVADAEATADFLTKVFSAETVRTHRSEDGSITHTEAKIGDSIVMIGQMPGGPEAHIHVYCGDAEAAFARAIALGAAVVQEFELRDDGDRRGGVKDANGTT